MAAGMCLVLLSTPVNEAIVQAVITFIESNITSQDWHYQEAAVMAFVSILDGPDPQVLAPLIHQALPVLLQMAYPQQEKSKAVKDLTVWTLAHICDLHSTTLNVDNELHSIVSVVVTGLEDRPRISANCAWALQTLVDNLSGYNYEEDLISPTGPMLRFYKGIITALMCVTEK